MAFEYSYDIAERHIRVASAVPLTQDERSGLFASVRGGRAQLEIDFRLGELPKPEGECVFTSDFFRMNEKNGDFIIETLDRRGTGPMLCARFSAGSDTVELTARPDTPKELFTMQQVWQAVNLPQQLLRTGVLTLHSASADTEKGVLLFCGASGAGKSTQAELWKKFAGACVQNGDKNAVTPENGRVHGMPISGTSGICRRFDRPLRAIVTVEKSAENRAWRLGAAAAMAALASCVHGVSPRGMEKNIVELIAETVGRIPVYRLCCTPDERAVKILKFSLDERTEDGVY